eukprot:1271189-Pyramimonas_sp.AAC.2
MPERFQSLVQQMSPEDESEASARDFDMAAPPLENSTLPPFFVPRGRVGGLREGLRPVSYTHLRAHETGAYL